jgi:hypothetical protein
MLAPSLQRQILALNQAAKAEAVDRTSLPLPGVCRTFQPGDLAQARVSLLHVTQKEVQEVQELPLESWRCLYMAIEPGRCHLSHCLLPH